MRGVAASLGPLGGNCVHLSHHAIALCAVDGIARELRNLGCEAQPPPIAFSGLGDRLADGLRMSEPPPASDVLQSSVSRRSESGWEAEATKAR
jgi:hypothetical protein